MIADSLRTTFEPVIWRRPTGPVLRGGVFQRDTPPFYPFPEVTQVAKGYCPVAMWHDLFWGRNHFGRRDTWIGGARGTLYHDIVGELRMDVAAGRIAVDNLRDESIARALAERYLGDFVNRRAVAPADADTLRDVFMPYFLRKWREGELSQLQGKRILMEVEVANRRCPFPIGQTLRHYPIRGRVDELNLSDGILIERTLEASPLSEDPPEYKFHQAWLYAQAITTLPEFQRPEALLSLWDRDLQIRVETPTRDYRVDSTSVYPMLAGRAYYWIRAIFRGVPGAAVWDEAACSPDEPDDACSHCRIDCHTIPTDFPANRAALGRLVHRHAQAFLFERVWQDDLWYYRQCWLPERILEEDGEYIPATIYDCQEDRLEVTLTTEQNRALQAQLHPIGQVEGIPEQFGGFCLGRRLRLSFLGSHALSEEQILITFRCNARDGELLRTQSMIQLFTLPGSEIGLSRRPPGFLKDLDRRCVGRLLKVGARSLTSAQQSGVVRTLQVLTREMEPIMISQR